MALNIEIILRRGIKYIILSVDPVYLFLSLSLKTVFRRKPPPIAVSAVALYVGHCPSPFWQWPTVA